ncbi:signal peptidase I [Candidatus Woesearchaeota archaeon CG10_big_fil_rev_8_21_14_0_10_37_12]|nr:MAG: signal peptidase I [Candidatus Woesearchaeota archaeon CG10_big_fil_rev_8_21_14_0_10_37_12]
MMTKSFLRKVWEFIWYEDSWISWVVNVLLAFIVIKFLLYPGLGLLLGTPAPIVAVVSGSMEHDGDFDTFWDEKTCCNDDCSVSIIQGDFYEQINISKKQFRSFGFVNGFNKGDIMILYSAEHIELGDVIVYVIPSKADPIIHRVIKNGDLLVTKGDHNCNVGSFEANIQKEQVIGKAVWRVPWLGYVKIVAVEMLNLAR